MKKPAGSGGLAWFEDWLSRSFYAQTPAGPFKER
jgi:hypothetical protein